MDAGFTDLVFLPETHTDFVFTVDWPLLLVSCLAIAAPLAGIVVFFIRRRRIRRMKKTVA